MKNAVFLLLLVSCAGKNSYDPKKIQDYFSTERILPDTIQAKKSISHERTKFPAADKAERKKFHTKKDTVTIRSMSGDTLRYSKDAFNDIVDNFPEFHSEKKSSTTGR